MTSLNLTYIHRTYVVKFFYNRNLIIERRSFNIFFTVLSVDSSVISCVLQLSENRPACNITHSFKFEINHTLLILIKRMFVIW